MGRVPVWGSSLLAGAVGGACFGLLTGLFIVSANLFYGKSSDGMVMTIVPIFVVSIAAGSVFGGTIGGLYAVAVKYLHLGFGADWVAAAVSSVAFGILLQPVGMQPSGLVGTISALLIGNGISALCFRRLEKLPVRLNLSDTH